MKIPPVKGTRDFYPPDMARRNWIIDGWKKVSVRNGFEEYDGPIFEYLKMFQIKSGDEIVDQLFSLKDRGGRDLALRPEITPTLARMVNQQINSLPKPIKWFSVPRLFRAERPQKGRLREFFQWNIDIIGVDDVLADAEIIFTTVDYLREAGLTHKDIKLKISRRKMLAALLTNLGISEKKIEPVYTVLDEKAKLPTDVFEKNLSDLVGDKQKTDQILEFMTPGPPFNKMVQTLASGAQSPLAHAATELCELQASLDLMGIKEYWEFDPSIVRGLAYYTGIVFEVHDIRGGLRAICGGGRYDNLLHDFGGPRIPATGMGMGDCVLGILLDERGLFKPEKEQLDYFVAFVDMAYRQETIKLTMKLRSAGHVTNFSYKDAKLSRQLKEASVQKARKCIIIGEEFKENKLAVKDMATGEQEIVDVDEFWSRLKA